MKNENYIKTDLLSRGWTNSLMDTLNIQPSQKVKNSYYGFTYLYKKDAIHKHEKNIEFIKVAYKKEINMIIATSTIKNIDTSLLLMYRLKKGGTALSRKKSIINLYIQRCINKDKKLKVDAVINITLPEIINKMINRDFTISSVDNSENILLQKRFTQLMDKFSAKESLYKKEFLNNMNTKHLDDLEKKFKKEVVAKDERMRKISSVHDIENFYTRARSIKRKFTLYLGPTNSGKTHKAIEKMLVAKRSIYLAPLRLLAREVYDTLKSKGLKVSLITGEEKIIDPDATHTCSTIEALNIDTKYDLAVIDEVQYLSDFQRGRAWTRAVYGAYADEVICLGSTDSEDIMRRITTKTNDIISVTILKRKTKLVATPEIKVNQIKSGDAIITFSRKNIYAINQILREEGLRVGLIYGMLPPELRIKTARDFNNGKLDVIVSTDAIGVGLNLDIQRIVFTDLTKYNGTGFKDIDNTLYKQISGRAARFGKHNIGYVTICPELSYDYDSHKWNSYTNSLHKENPTLESLYFFPELEHLLKIADEINNYHNLKLILSKYKNHFRDKSEMFKLNIEQVNYNLDIVNRMKMDLKTKYILMFAPTNKDNIHLFNRLLYVMNNNLVTHFTAEYSYKHMSVKMLEESIQDINIFKWMHFQFPENFKIEGVQREYEQALFYLDKRMKKNSKAL